MKEKGTTNPKSINMNVSNILQVVEQYSINDGWVLSLNNLYVRYKSYKERTTGLMAKSPAFRKLFLSQQSTEVMDQQKTDDAKRIKETICREAHTK